MSQRWTAVAASQFPWERAGLEYVCECCPGYDPFRAWSNFEFITEDGSINEVDRLVVSLYTISRVEIKSRPGRVSGAVPASPDSSGTLVHNQSYHASHGQSSHIILVYKGFLSSYGKGSIAGAVRQPPPRPCMSQSDAV
jgi:hypothetical protein